jgi:hypothetical protein
MQKVYCPGIRLFLLLFDVMFFGNIQHLKLKIQNNTKRFPKFYAPSPSHIHFQQVRITHPPREEWCYLLV